MDESHQTHYFEGIYPSFYAAISRGKSIIQNLQTCKQNTPDYNRAY